MAAFLRDVCTVAELQALGHRLAARAPRSTRASPTPRSRARVGCSTTTVTRVAHWLRHGEGGYRLVLDRTRGCAREPTLRVALPSKGRLAEPAFGLFRDAGMDFEPDGRAPAHAAGRARPRGPLRARRRHPGAGSTTAPSTSASRARTRWPRRASSWPSCCSSASAAAGSRWRRRPAADRAARDLGGAAIATSYPATVARYLARGASPPVIADLGLGRARAVAGRRRGGRRPRLERRDAAPERARASSRPCSSREAVLLGGPRPRRRSAAARRAAARWCSRPCSPRGRSAT